MIKTFAITAFALSMTAAFAGNDKATSASSTNSAQPNVAMETPKSSMGSSSADSSQVKQVQQALKDKGQDPGSIDGKMGPKTTAALQSFQQAQGISGSGLDQQTLTALGVSGGASASASTSSSNQPSTSSSMSSSNQPAASSDQPATSSNQPSSTTNSTTNATKQ